jgi:hypothetical protein
MRKKHNWIYYLGTAVAVFSALYFIQQAVAHVEKLPSLTWNFQTFSAFVVTTLIYGLVVVIGGLIWCTLLKDYNLGVHWLRICQIFCLSQFGKYLPGNVAHHLGRVVMARNSNIPTPVSIQTMVLEVSLGISVAAGLTLATFLSLTLPQDHNDPILGLSGILPLFFATLFLPVLGIKGLNRFAPTIVKKITGGQNLKIPEWGSLVKVLSLFTLNFMLIGCSMNLHAIFLFGETDIRFFELTGVFALSWVAGYLTPGAPAGLGVREAILVSTITPFYGPTIAVGLSITARVVNTLGDGLGFLIGFLMRRSLFSTNRT